MRKMYLPQVVTGLAVCLSPQFLTTVADNLFVGDYSGGSIYEFNTALGGASQTTFASPSGLFNPGGLAFDSQGALYAVNGEGSAASGSIRKYAPNGSYTVFASGLNTPSGLAFDDSGNLKVAFAYGYAIDSVTPAGVVSSFATLPLDSPHIYGLAYAANGVLYAVSQTGGGSVTEFNSDGSVKTTFASGLGQSFGIAFNSSGKVFVSGSAAGDIFEFNADGTGKTVFASGLSIPTGIAFDSAGNLYVAEAGAGRIDVFDPSGHETTFATRLGTAWFIAFEPVPEPSTWALLGVGVGAIALGLRKNRS